MPALDATTHLRRPLDDFSALHTCTISSHGAATVDLSYPNLRLDGSAGTVLDSLATLAATIGRDELRTSPFGGHTIPRRRIAAALSTRHILPYTYHDLLLTPGAGAALYISLRALFDPGERVMVVSPCWMDVPLYLADLDLGCDLVPTTERKQLDVDQIEGAWTTRTRGLVLSHPASPTGVCPMTSPPSCERCGASKSGMAPRRS
jgi:aspartate aminotransferase